MVLRVLQDVAANIISNQRVVGVDGRTEGTEPNGTTLSCHFVSVRDDKDACKIPKALCNDNFYGFMDREILRWGVRWIELAAASPILNCIVTYYVEGDRGHLMDEPFLT